MKNNKGITLIALIITIIVMLILAVVTINMIIGEDGIIAKANDAKDRYSVESIKEEIKIDNIFNYSSNKEDFENTVDDVTELIVETKINNEKIVIFYDKKEDKNKIFYRDDLVTADERNILNGKGIRPLKADVNKDGKLDENDLFIYNAHTKGEKKIENVVYYDLSGDGKINALDTVWVDAIVCGSQSIEILYK